MGVYNNKNNLGRSITDKNFVMRVITLILAAVTAVVIFVKPQGAAAAQKKSKQAEGGVNMSLKNGVLTVKGKGAMWDTVSRTAYKKNNIKKIVVKEGVESLPRDVFKDCKKVTSIKIASTVKRIGIHAFANTGIKSITIPKSVKKLGSGVCDGCTKLETVTMPGDIDVIKINPRKDYITGLFYLKGDYVSSQPLKKVKFTTALNTDILPRVGACENYEISQKDSRFKSIDGMIYTKDGKTLVRIPLGRKKAVISDKCTTVSMGSYSHELIDFSHKFLSEIVFPKSVSSVIEDQYDKKFDYNDERREDYYECKDIKVTLNSDYLDNESIQRLWISNEYWKNSLKDELFRREFAKLNEKDEHMMMLADGYLCTYILNDAPEGTSTVLQNLLIPDNVKTIGMQAFKDYYTRSVILSSSVQKIENNAFNADYSPDSNVSNAKVYVKGNNILMAEKVFGTYQNYEIIMY